MPPLLPDDDVAQRFCQLCHKKAPTVIPIGIDGIPICGGCAAVTPGFEDLWVTAAQVFGTAINEIKRVEKTIEEYGE
jgi:hypothetical protein